jgi:hypothetical protein
LAQAFPDEYKTYLEEEKLNDYTQGKTWIDIHGNTSSSMDANTSTNTNRGRDTPHQTRNQQGASEL